MTTASWCDTLSTHIHTRCRLPPPLCGGQPPAASCQRQHPPTCHRSAAVCVLCFVVAEVVRVGSRRREEKRRGSFGPGCVTALLHTQQPGALLLSVLNCVPKEATTAATGHNNTRGGSSATQMPRHHASTCTCTPRTFFGRASAAWIASSAVASCLSGHSHTAWEHRTNSRTWITVLVTTADQPRTIHLPERLGREGARVCQCQASGCSRSLPNERASEQQRRHGLLLAICIEILSPRVCG